MNNGRADRDLRRALIGLLEIKDSDIRIPTIKQGRDAVDRSIHIGGAMCATVPLVALYYSGVLCCDAGNPTRPGQDLFVLSKGRAVAALASIHADLGCFGRQLLKNSRSLESALDGHPGPLLPGVHLSTGPEGHNLDLVYLATAPNFDTNTNGPTHMGNDDAALYSQLAHLKIVDLACPDLLLSFMKWIMESGKGLVCARIPRAPTWVVHEAGVRFEYGRAYRLRHGRQDRACLIPAGGASTRRWKRQACWRRKAFRSG